MEQELDIKDLIFSLWRKKYVILLVTIISFIVGFLLFGRNSNEVNSTNTSERRIKLYRK